MTESAPKNTLRKVVEVSDLPPGTAFSQIGRTFIVTDEDVPVSDKDMELFREAKRRKEEWEIETKRRREEWERMSEKWEREAKKMREELEIEAMDGRKPIDEPPAGIHADTNNEMARNTFYGEQK